VALAECAYNRAYIRTIPPCWVALLDPPDTAEAGTVKGFTLSYRDVEELLRVGLKQAGGRVGLRPL
jgi:hypothetical protein